MWIPIKQITFRARSLIIACLQLVSVAHSNHRPDLPFLVHILSNKQRHCRDSGPPSQFQHQGHA
ncbi:unnamed protein product [Amoebophrya sp. A25]|nr:unnamed protein product [Amoebophrya sp. A25]|eukprot:GSA25T00013234001.1